MADKKPRRDKKMSELKLNTPVKLNEVEDCSCCDKKAVYSYLVFGNSGSPELLCEECLECIIKSDRELLEEKLEEIEEEKKRDENYKLIELVCEKIEDFLTENEISFDKIESRMSSSIYFEFEVDGVDKKIRISDHDARHTYNILNGQADFNIAVGYRSGEASFEVLEEKDIEVLISKLNKKYFNK